MDVTVAELQDHLEEYLERAARGERIRITAGTLASDVVLGPAGKLPQPTAARRRRRHRSERTIAEVLAEDRSE